MDDGVQHEGEASYIWDLHPLVGPAEGDGLLRLGEVSGVDDGVDAPNRYDSPGGEVLVALVLRGGQPPKIVWMVLLGS